MPILTTGAGKYPVASGGGAYAGPGDVVASAAAFWGARAYTTASIGGNAMRVVRASDSGQTNIVTVAGGGLDKATLASYLTATTGKCVTLFNQVGTSLFDATQATDGNRPAIGLASLNTYPCVTFVGPNPGTQGLSTGALVAPITHPFTVCVVVRRTANFSSYGTCVGVSDASMQSLFLNSPNSVGMFSGSVAPSGLTCTDSAYHRLIYIYNTASSLIVVDGVASSALAPGGDPIPIGQTIAIGTGNNAFTGDIVEVGVWPIAFNSTQYAAMDTNMKTFYGL